MNNPSHDDASGKESLPLSLTQLPHDIEPPTEPQGYPAASSPRPRRRLPKRPLVITSASLLLLALVAGGLFVYFSRQTAPVSPSAVTTPSAPVQAPANTITVPDAIGAIDPTHLPLGENKVSTTPQVGYVYYCQTSFSSAAGGAQVAGPWINTSAKTWDSTAKVAVSGSVTWSSAAYNATVSGTARTITSAGLPINGQTTGTFPVASNDKAYAYDRNPNHIAAQTINWTLPAVPTAASQPHCVPGGAIGILADGVVLFNALDGEGRDAAAYETLDSCDGHPERTSEYHHHDIPKCLVTKYQQPSSSTLIGYATDGYGIYVERDKNGALLTNANLDTCHGRTSAVMWDGKATTMYHYVATLEFPYTIGCFHGTSAVAAQTTTPPSSQTSTPPPPQRR